MVCRLTDCFFFFICLAISLSFPSIIRAEGSTNSSTAAVVPPVGSITGPERKACAVEIRAQLRYHGYALAVQKNVRDAAAAAGIKGKPTSSQLKEAGTAVGAEIIFVTNIYDDSAGEFYLDMAALNTKTGTSRAVQTKLPSRGAAPYESEQFLPAVAAATAALLGRNPHPVHGPFPAVAALDTGRLIKSVPAPKKATAAAEGKKAEEKTKAGEHKKDSASKDKKDSDSKQGDKAEKAKKKQKWKKWDHAGLFMDLGFMFSWCLRDGMCENSTKGYGARFRFGVRIASFVALSFSAAAVDHQMPLTTDTEVFLNVKQALVYAGLFGGLRVHPVRRFPVDPYVGIDFGYSWLLYAQNTEIEVDSSIPDEVSSQLEELVTKRREINYLRGFTIAPEIGVNFFAAPPLAFGIHVQWIIPFWKQVCVGVYNPTLENLTDISQVCTEVGKVNSATGLEEESASRLSKKSNLPLFVSLELDLTFVF